MFFDDVQASKRDIYKELKDRKGVYMFINKINNCCYVGSSVNLSKRMATHFFHSSGEINQEVNIVVSRAMRKYGLENFSLAILEFLSSDVTDCSEFEQK
jgi:group I intron endonuclease